jgi:hypothetical protein
MRYEDWTFREAEVRLREHGELRRALGLRQVPDHTTMCRSLQGHQAEGNGDGGGKVSGLRCGDDTCPEESERRDSTKERRTDRPHPAKIKRGYERSC